MFMKWPALLKSSLSWAALTFFAMAIALLLRTSLSEGDIGAIFMAAAVTVSMLVVLAPSYEPLYTSRQGKLESRSWQLHLLRNYLRSVTLVAHPLKINTDNAQTPNTSRIRLQELVQSLPGIYDTFLAKKWNGLIAAELVRLTQGRVMIKEFSDSLAATETFDTEALRRSVERVSRSNRQAEQKLKRMLGAENLEQFEEMANASHDQVSWVMYTN